MTTKKVEWKPDINIVMVIRKSQDYKPDEKLRKKFKSKVG